MVWRPTVDGPGAAHLGFGVPEPLSRGSSQVGRPRRRPHPHCSSFVEAIDALARAGGFRVTYQGARPTAMLFNAEIDTRTVGLRSGCSKGRVSTRRRLRRDRDKRGGLLVLARPRAPGVRKRRSETQRRRPSPSQLHAPRAAILRCPKSSPGGADEPEPSPVATASTPSPAPPPPGISPFAPRSPFPLRSPAPAHAAPTPSPRLQRETRGSSRSGEALGR